MIILPLRSDLPDYSFSVEMDSVTYGLRLRYNVRDGGWYLDLLTAEGTPIMSGRRLVLDTNLLRQISGATRPAGALIAISTTSDKSEPGSTDLGTRVLLAYASPGDLA